ncbi:bifunctional 2-polyprenyl-6-hydroxyphenol methylase/3-demethylubiquinol 3-O-methyltransferase UbiG [Caballeronia sp. Sq4a]|uniref:class I SAM-dependent methyltransferase n=1 Tax=Caballeronia sp. Sq4a TaxID=2878152 RepID=UPI0020C1377D|nr:class I SAM-dependent methyltransferase [Caballeronia sp. Sq4a]
MERLNFGTESKYIAVEAAVHLARYATVRQLCVGKRVLDASCGEGYGTALLARWGAKSAVGVDISADAIEAARKTFSDSGATYVCSSGENLPSALGDSKFDLIVSLETVEHVDDPALFLSNLRNLLAENGTLVVSCPNDFWYYDKGGKNEYHLHKWTFTEFKEFSESVLGKASAWHLGTLAVGFSITREGGAVKVAPATGNQKLMLDYVDSNALITAMDEDSAFAEHDTAFYVGVWGESAPEAVFSGFPVSMDMARQPLFPREGAWVVNRRGTEFIPDWKVKEDYQSLKDRISALEDELAISQREATRLGILRRVILGENELASRAMSRYKHELQTTREELNEAKRSHLDTLNRVSGLEERTAALESHAAALEAEAAASAARLASVPWRVVWVWWKIRRIIPTRVLVRTVRVLNFVRGKHA